jgi:hypothetical protein
MAETRDQESLGVACGGIRDQKNRDKRSEIRNESEVLTADH